MLILPWNLRDEIIEQLGLHRATGAAGSSLPSPELELLAVIASAARRSAGAFVVEPEPLDDERGCFARTFDADEFARARPRRRGRQSSVSFNRGAGTLRGMHFQAAPHDEAKLVRCTRGAIFDVVVDLRPARRRYRRWFGVELDRRQPARRCIVPRGFAHGFLTLDDDTEVLYQMSHAYVAGGGARRALGRPGVRHRVARPAAGGRTISERDATYPGLRARDARPRHGATGFIGRHALAPLRAARLRGPRRPARAAGRRRVAGTGRPARRAPAVVARSRPTHLLHLAWYAEHGRFWTRRRTSRWVGASLELVRAFAAAGGRARGDRRHVRGVRLDGVDGRCAEGATPLRPATLYGVSKDGLPTRRRRATPRGGLVAGLGADLLLLRPRRAARAARRLGGAGRALGPASRRRTTDGSQVRDFLHVEDVGDAFAALVDSAVTGPVNVASGEPIARARHRRRWSPRRPGAPTSCASAPCRSAPASPTSSSPTSRRLRDEVGWRPREPLEARVERTVDWWREQGA